MPLSAVEIVKHALTSLYKSLDDFKNILKHPKDDEHDETTTKVYRRLILRHSILKHIEELTSQHIVSKELTDRHPDGIENPKLNNNANKTAVDTTAETHDQKKYRITTDKHNNPTHENHYIVLPPYIRTYNLAVTDVFVEKALAYLGRTARQYHFYGVLSCSASFTCILLAGIHAFVSLSSGPGTDWDTYKIIVAFFKSFTAYGIAVLLAVFSFKLGKALFDQSERLHDRRHALRQGRLFIHVNGGKVTMDEMNKAFNWNFSQSNAFAGISTDAQAPWGSVITKLINSVTTIGKAGMKTAEKITKKQE